jgi:hypothetical protein
MRDLVTRKEVHQVRRIMKQVASEGGSLDDVLGAILIDEHLSAAFWQHDGAEFDALKARYDSDEYKARGDAKMKKKIYVTEDGTPLDDLPQFKLRNGIHELVKSFPEAPVELTTWALINVAANELAFIPDELQRTRLLADQVKLLAGATAHFADEYRHGNLDDDDDDDDDPPAR